MVKRTGAKIEVLPKKKCQRKDPRGFYNENYSSNHWDARALKGMCW